MRVRLEDLGYSNINQTLSRKVESCEFYEKHLIPLINEQIDYIKSVDLTKLKKSSKIFKADGSEAKVLSDVIDNIITHYHDNVNKKMTELMGKPNDTVSGKYYRECIDFKGYRYWFSFRFSLDKGYPSTMNPDRFTTARIVIDIEISRFKDGLHCNESVNLPYRYISIPFFEYSTNQPFFHETEEFMNYPHLTFKTPNLQELISLKDKALYFEKELNQVINQINNKLLSNEQ